MKQNTMYFIFRLFCLNNTLREINVIKVEFIFVTVTKSVTTPLHFLGMLEDYFFIALHVFTLS